MTRGSMREEGLPGAGAGAGAAPAPAFGLGAGHSFVVAFFHPLPMPRILQRVGIITSKAMQRNANRSSPILKYEHRATRSTGSGQAESQRNPWTANCASVSPCLRVHISPSWGGEAIAERGFDHGG